MRGRGGRSGSRLWLIFLHKCARKIILVQNLLRQAEAQLQATVQIPVLQGTGKTSSVDNARVQPCDHNRNTDVGPTRTCETGSSIFSTMC